MLKISNCIIRDIFVDISPGDELIFPSHNLFLAD